MALNLSEGSAKPSEKERKRFYSIAFASLREVQSLIDLEEERLKTLFPLVDQLGSHLYCLYRRKSKKIV